MNKNLVRLVAVAGILGMTVGAPVGYAFSQEEGREGYQKGGPAEFFKDLNLTPEQKEKMKAQREGQKALFQQQREQMKTKMEALHAELGKPDADRAVVNGLVADINTLKGQMFAQRIDGVLALKEILTPEQFAKFQAKHKERFGKHGGWKKEHQGGPQGQGMGSGPDEE